MKTGKFKLSSTFSSSKKYRSFLTKVSHLVQSCTVPAVKIKNQLRALESIMAQHRVILPLCQQIAGFGIGFPELLAFHAAVTKKANTENTQIRAAAFGLLQDIEDNNRLGNMKKQLYNTGMQLHIMNQIMPRRLKKLHLKQT